MKSVRLDPDLAARLREAARAAGVTESKLMRDVVAGRCDAILGGRLERRLADLLGVVQSKGGRARRSHRRFSEILKKAAAARH